MSQTVSRALRLVQRSAEGPLGLAEAADLLGVNKSTALRLLQTLEEARFVRRVKAGSYVLGTGVIELAQIALDSTDLREVASGFLRELQQETGHVVHLAELIGDSVIYIDKVDSGASEAVTLPSRVGREASLHASAVAKTILAYAPEKLVDRLIGAGALTRYTDTTITDRTAFDEELRQIRERGWALDRGEHDSYVLCVAVPVRDALGSVVAAVSVTAIEMIASLDDLQERLPIIQGAAAEISAGLGYDAR